MTDTTDTNDTPAEREQHSQFPISDRANRLYILGDTLDSPGVPADVLERAAQLVDDIERELRATAAREGVDLRPDRERPPNAPRWLSQLYMTYQSSVDDPSPEEVERLDELAGRLDREVVTMARRIDYEPQYATHPEDPDWEDLARDLAEDHLELVYETRVLPAHREFMAALRADRDAEAARAELADALSQFDALTARLTDSFETADIEVAGPALPENWDEAISE